VCGYIHKEDSVANSREVLLIAVSSSVCGYIQKEDSVANSRKFLLVAVVTNKQGRARIYICISLPVCVGTYIRKTVLPTPGKFC
jgi:hypothetical protein